jgi:hypothetical protein
MRISTKGSVRTYNACGWWKSLVKVQCSTVLQFTKDSIIEVVDTKFYIVGNSSACSSAGKVHFIGS